MLELNEAVIGESGRPRRLGYRHHFQDEQNKLVFRYDNSAIIMSKDEIESGNGVESLNTGTEKRQRKSSKSLQKW
ncbi:MAG: hypothetical protein DCC43_13440 [Candidatus Brocadia sp.]|nr:hypothetical protein [Candidatus Brocadia fulgida]MCC6325677.1 hypothetical protein [Candidatus Brocadia sp.]MCE7912529.1 hypothetical protein [Candidatus Brocadia sp. AMX3]MDG5997728.1 hypothetical protein [Candidatus Brocadia sp.]RIJ92744.1 MAG: hypothetical protein DCC43_13440 [Candidatus Brocadia sp.]